MKWKAGVFIEVSGEADTEEEFREMALELISENSQLGTIEYIVEDEEQ